MFIPDSYKNFVIVDGQVKIANGNSEKQFKLSRMVQKKRSFKNGMKLREKGSEEERNIIRVGDDEIEKVEKKSLRILNNDLSGESDVEKMKMVHVVKRPAKHHSHHSGDESLPNQKPVVDNTDDQTDTNDLENKTYQKEAHDNWMLMDR